MLFAVFADGGPGLWGQIQRVRDELKSTGSNVCVDDVEGGTEGPFYIPHNWMPSLNAQRPCLYIPCMVRLYLTGLAGPEVGHLQWWKACRASV